MSANHNLHKLMKGVHMNLSQLQSFVALADTGSFTEAAYTVNLTQSAVSQQIRALENKFQVTLVERGRRNFALTAEGSAFLTASRGGDSGQPGRAPGEAGHWLRSITSMSKST